MAIVNGTINADTINLSNGATEDADWIYGLNGDDTLKGGGGADWLYGGWDDDTLKGGGGADHLFGGNGIDTASYVDSNEGVEVDLSTGAGDDGTAEGDTLIGIENVYGSAYHDRLHGDGADNTFFGFDGPDYLYGYGGDDSLYGGGGYDTLTGGVGADHLDGGAGNDWADYRSSFGGVAVNLMANSGHSGHAANDTFTSIENVSGSDYRDVLTGNNDDNALQGNEGNDDLIGLWGNDILRGGDGTDLLEGGPGDDAADYLASPEAVVVSLLTGSAHYGHAAGDILHSIEDLNGSVYDDYLFGDEAENYLRGREGNDTLKGYGGADTLDGGQGVDVLSGGLQDDIYYVDANDVVEEFAGGGADVVWARDTWTLTANADVETLQAYYTAGPSFNPPVNLTGNGIINTVIGNYGSNVLNGGDGSDHLTGLGGQDSFLFDTPLNAMTNVDDITDFNVADDTILLDETIFSSSLGAGKTISESEFVIGPAALDANDRIIYNSGTGAVLYDSDGNGAGAAVQFAQLTQGLALTHQDFYVVA